MEIRDNEAVSRYEAVEDGTDGQVVGFAEYRRESGQVVFTHTEVSLEGRGVGSELARGALDDVRRRGETAVPQCWFIARYVERHPEYADLVAG